jgi:hypothetical protein
MERAQLCIVQPRGYVHSLGFLDQARYLQHHLSRLGITTTIGKNRLSFDAINFVLGAHLGFDSTLTEQYRCVFVNLEQLGVGGANVGQHYLRLLREQVTVDYDASNLAAYQGDRQVPLVGFANAPFLHPGTHDVPLEERPLDVLFIGSTNPRRQQLIRQIEATGVNVATFDSAVYGPERDEFVRQAKAVINLHFYETARFAQARASFVLSQSTPLVSEVQRDGVAPEPYERSVLWFGPETIAEFFGRYFGSSDFYRDARAALAHFQSHDPLPQVEAIWRYAQRHTNEPKRVTLPARLNANMARKGYCLGWLNVSMDSSQRPDWVVDLTRPLPHTNEVAALAGLQTMHLGLLDMNAASVHTLFDNALLLLDIGGVVVFEVNCPNHGNRDVEQWLGGMLAAYTTEFWRQGWLDHRFAIAHLGWLDAEGMPTPTERAACRVVLKKVGCSLRERMLARTAREDFGLELTAQVQTFAEAAQ